MGSRILYRLAKEGWISSRFAHVHGSYRTPVLATLVVVSAMIASTAVLELVSLARLTCLLVLIIFTLMNASLIVIKRGHREHQGYINVPAAIRYLGFHGQLGQCRTTAVFGLILCAIVGGGSWRLKRRYWHEAVDRGRAADNLMAAPYEELLPLPLTEVRATLGIPPTDVAHPEGHFFTRCQLPASGIAPYEPWDYETSLVEGVATRS